MAWSSCQVGSLNVDILRRCRPRERWSLGLVKVGPDVLVATPKKEGGGSGEKAGQTKRCMPKLKVVDSTGPRPTGPAPQLGDSSPGPVGTPPLGESLCKPSQGLCPPSPSGLPRSGTPNPCMSRDPKASVDPSSSFTSMVPDSQPMMGTAAIEDSTMLGPAGGPHTSTPGHALVGVTGSAAASTPLGELETPAQAPREDTSTLERCTTPGPSRAALPRGQAASPSGPGRQDEEANGIQRQAETTLTGEPKLLHPRGLDNRTSRPTTYSARRRQPRPAHHPCDQPLKVSPPCR